MRAEKHIQASGANKGETGNIDHHTAGCPGAITRQDLIQQASSTEIQLANDLHHRVTLINPRANTKTGRPITVPNTRPLTIGHRKPHLTSHQSG
jgi:hypothetical protein